MAYDANIALGATLRNQLLAIDRTARSLDISSGRLATGKKVNSALDNATSYFAARSLQDKAADFQRLTDNMGQNIQAIRQADQGLGGIEKLLQMAETIGTEAREYFQSTSVLSGLPLPDQILADNPNAYWQMDDLNGANNQGTIGGINGSPGTGVTFNQPGLYPDGAPSAYFDGTSNAVITVPDSGQINNTTVANRTIELTFNADTTAGRQVLYEEGATVNSLGIYIDNGNLYVEGRDSGDWGPFGINEPINAGQTYHVALVLDQPNGELRGYLNGEQMSTIGAVTIPLSSHTGDIAIGGTQDGLVFHDGPDGAAGKNFTGFITDVALYNRVLDDDTIRSHGQATQEVEGVTFQKDFNVLMDQITQLAKDAGYRGNNLLFNDSIVTVFNKDESSRYATAGGNFTADGLSVDGLKLNNITEVETTLDRVRSAIGKVRSFQRSLATDINVIQNRIDFTERNINTELEGADKLTMVDLNEETAKVLSNQTMQAVQMANLSSNVRGRDIANLLFGGA